MKSILKENYIRCCLENEINRNKSHDNRYIEVIFARTKDLIRYFEYFEGIISDAEAKRAEKFYFERDRETYITCHALLREALSKKLHVAANEIKFVTNRQNKPRLEDCALSFNITHTSDAFAIAISDDIFTGIDLEKIQYKFDFKSIIRNYFSRREQIFILASECESPARFFRLWTRKEAMLKAIGTGIVDDLRKIEVINKDNFIDSTIFNEFTTSLSYDEIFIYSVDDMEYSLSIAIPFKSDIEIISMSQQNIEEYIFLNDSE